ncbi:response regulator transcription factor [Cycloclasticus sp. PY97N]|uniref:response regulator n=1 Tax=Cycloclasticus sp. PY97N TaxID=728003 RepID=UPI001F0513AC|nr:response regulator transcription factor [Cycloclasticus sp. PY97N]
MNSNSIKVLLVDDHELVRSGIEHILQSDPDIEVVAIGSSGEEAVKLAEQLKPDVILMDLNMPGIGGAEALKRILSANPVLKLLP